MREDSDCRVSRGAHLPRYPVSLLNARAGYELECAFCGAGLGSPNAAPLHAERVEARAEAIGRIWEALDICNAEGFDPDEVIADALRGFPDAVVIRGIR